jgi:hypothetical protein
VRFATGLSDEWTVEHDNSLELQFFTKDNYHKCGKSYDYWSLLKSDLVSIVSTLKNARHCRAWDRYKENANGQIKLAKALPASNYPS